MLKRWRVEYYPHAPDLLSPPRVPGQSDAPQACDKIFSRLSVSSSASDSRALSGLWMGPESNHLLTLFATALIGWESGDDA